ncbi:MAG TPA: sigma-E factor negative regulatory protein [Steroidobacteraceae bacterium]|nr:sigma-E factor negative regulatory protein [Steroidobacteraceae bacterium]
MNEELDSQLSAMFDGELPGGECELIARRLSRDEALRSQWSRYSMIGAAIRAERGVALHDRVAWRVQSTIAAEPVYGDGADVGSTNARTAAVVPAEVLRRASTRRWARFTRPLAGVGIAASVAAAAILFLRVQGGDSGEMLAENAATPTQSIVLTPEPAAVTAGAAVQPERVALSSNGREPDRYTTPAPSTQTNLAQNASLANYVVAHSEYSGPISRRMALLGLLGSENGSAALPESTAAKDAGAEAPDAP